MLCQRILRICLLVLAFAPLGGCAALTNPVADGVAVRDLPKELTCGSHEGETIVPPTWFEQEPPTEYLLDTGDVLGVWVEGVLDDKTPVAQVRVADRDRRFPERGDIPSTVGYPLPVRSDGTLSLPMVNPVLVRGKTIEEVDDLVRRAYMKAKILQPGRDRVFVTLQHKRLYQIVVFRQDIESPGASGTSSGNPQVTAVGSVLGGTFLLGGGATGVGHQVNLPAYENDLLHALALTGGFPGTNAAKEIVIYRKNSRIVRGKFEQEQSAAKLGTPLAVASDRPDSKPGEGSLPEVLPLIVAPPSGESRISFPLQLQKVNATQTQEILPQPREKAPISPESAFPLRQSFDTAARIPLRIRIGGEAGFNPKDVILQNGDVVYVGAAPVETFYTAGLLPPGEYLLPRDYDLDVVSAVTKVRGPLINGAFGGSNLSGQLINPGIGGPSPRLLTVIRKTPDGGQIPITVDLFVALRDPRERLVLRNGDVLVLQETRCQALARYFTQQVTFTSLFTIFRSPNTIGTGGVIVP